MWQKTSAQIREEQSMELALLALAFAVSLGNNKNNSVHYEYHKKMISG